MKSCNQESATKILPPWQGEMGRRILDFDWERTPLGPLEQWPSELKIATGIMLDSKYQMFIWWGPDLINLYNDAYISVCGKRHPEALGKPAATLWHEIWETVGPQAELVFQNNATWNEQQLLIMERNGYPEETFFSYSYSPIRNDEGKVEGLFCACTEDTERVLGARRLTILRHLSAATLEGKSASDACERAAEILAANNRDVSCALIYLLDAGQKQATLAAHAGFPPGHSLLERILPSDEARLPRTPWPLEKILAGEKMVLRDLKELPGGHWPEITNTAMVLPLAKHGSDELSGFLVVGASPRRPFDREYEEFFELLASSIATSVSNASAYEQEKKRAEALAELDRAKTTFFSNISHELRTPLTLMLSPLEEHLQREPKEDLMMAHRNGQRLLKLVNTLLDFSRIEAGRVEASYEPVDLASLTIELSSVFRSAMEKAGLKYTVDCRPLPEPVWVDREMWEKIVLNLLSNAFKFTFSGEVAVSLRWAGETVELKVADTGVGIPRKELPNLFERFHRIRDTRARTYEGTGIGLALVKELAAMHGGSVHVCSEEGKGSVFSLRIRTGKAHLPAEKLRARPNRPSTHAGAAAYLDEVRRWSAFDDDNRAPGKNNTRRGAARILLAEDNADMRDYLQRLLEATYSVCAVPDGATALKQALNRPPDLVLTDVMMPGMDGYALLRELRGSEKTRAIPVVMLSAQAGEEARVGGLEAGADDYLIKPFSARELLARVESQLQMARLRREGEERFRRILSSISDGFQVVDAAGRFTYFNRAAREMLTREGVEAEKLLGRKVYDAFPESQHDAFGKALQQVLKERVQLEVENYFTPFQKWFSIRYFPMDDGGVSMFFRDITERKNADRLLKENQQFLDNIVGTSPALIVATDSTGRVLLFNKACEELTGYSAREVLGRTISELFLPDEWKPVVAARFADPHSLELRKPHVNPWRTKSGEERLIEWRCIALPEEDGAELRVLGAGIDITERTKTEEALRASEEQYRSLFESIDEGFCVLQLIFDSNNNPIDYRFLETNPTFERQTGLVDATGKTARQLVPDLDSSWFRIYGNVALTGNPARFENEAPAMNRWFNVYAFRVGAAEQRKVALLFNDITEGKLAEMAVRISEAQRSAIIDTAPVGMYLVDAQLRLLQVNPRARPVFGNIEGPIGKDMTEILFRLWPSETATELVGRFRQTLETGESYYSPGFAEDRLDRGVTEYYDWEVHRVTLPDGQFGLVCYFIDISAHVAAQVRLQESESRFRSVAENIPQLAWMTDATGEIQWFNSRWIEFTGMGVEEIREGGWKLVQHPDHAERVQHGWNEALSIGERWEDTFPLRGADGTYHWFLSRAFPICDADGKITRWFGTNTDITARKNAEEALRRSEEKLRLITDAAPALISYVDRQYHYRFANKQYERWFGHSLDSVIGQSMKDVLGETVFQRIKPRLDEAFAGRQVRFEVEAPYRDGGTRWIDAAYIPDIQQDGTVEGLHILVVDITERKKAEFELTKAKSDLELINRELEDRVERRTAKLKETIGDLEAFSYSIAHDMRAPLRSMHGFTSILSAEYQDKLDPAGQDFLRRIRNSAERLDRLIQDVLSYSKVVTGELKLESVDTSRLIHEIVESYPNLQSSGATIIVKDPLPRLLANPAALTQVISNLLGNAVKFVARDVRAHVIVRAEPRGEFVRLWFEDNGIGIAPEAQKRMFQIFQRLHGPELYEGTGIGLAIVRKAVERMGGQIGVDSEPERGSRFWVELRGAL